MNVQKRLPDGKSLVSGGLARVAAVLGALALVAIGTADASTTRTVIKSSSAAGLGRIIVAGSNRHTLYGFSNDPRNKSTCYRRCSKVWIPLWAKGKIVAAKGSGVNGRKLGKIRRRNGSYQVTYYRQPLYLYTRDRKPGVANGHYQYQFGNSWYAIDINGSPAPPPCYGRRRPAPHPARTATTRGGATLCPSP